MEGMNIMPDDLILVLDAGTGGGRAIAVESTGMVAARSFRAWSYFEPPGLELYGKEFNPVEFQGAMAGCAKEVMDQVSSQAIKGVVTTGMRQGCVFLDKEGKPLYAGPNRDVRGILFTDEIESVLGRERAYAVTGRWPPFMFAPSRYYWFKKERPEVAQSVDKILMINDWLLYWLSGQIVSEPTNASDSMMFDISSGEWSADIMDALDMDSALLPELMPCGTVAGEVTSEASQQTGIPRGTPVITGMADTQAALLGAGVVEPGRAGIVAGSTAPVMIVMDEPGTDPDYKLWTSCHALPRRWLAESNSGDAGLVYKGYVEGHLGLLCHDPGRAYAKAEELAEDAGMGAYGARACLGPIIWDIAGMSPSARGGISFTYPLGEENAGPGNVARAILENIGFAVRANFEQAKALKDAEGPAVLCGGMSRIGLFAEIVSNVLGRGLEVAPEHEATAIGCAMAGFFALGHYPGIEEAAKDMKREPKVMEPDEDDHDDYNDMYEEWLDLYREMMG